MRESSCVIYDMDEQYAYKLMNVMNKKERMPFKTLIFTYEQALLEYLEVHTPDILIISERSLSDNLIKNQLENKIENVLVLREDSVESDLIKETFGEGLYEIYKYQSSENIIREVMNYCVKPYFQSSTKADVIGIYSPVNNSYKTTFSLALANAYGTKSSVLYINLEEFSGLNEILQEYEHGNLSDAVYYYKTSKENFINQLDWMISKVGRIHYIPPVKCAEDISYISTSDWIDIISYIANNCNYELIILDISNAIKEQWKLLDMCKKVFMPIKEDYISKKKVNSFETYLLDLGKESVCDLIEKITVPYDGSLSLSPDFFEKIEWSIVGKFAKEVSYGKPN